MKFTDNQKKYDQPKPEDLRQTADDADYEYVEMLSQSDEQADKLQAEVVNGCGRVLLALNDLGELCDYIRPKNDTDKDSKGIAETSVRNLQDFHYTIGFAGGQSSGKSTVVNAILQYPLMPTCKLATTCTPVELFYSERIRIMVTDADTEKLLMDYPCDKATPEGFQKLKEYTCAVASIPQIIENLQAFVDGSIRDKKGLTPDELDMEYDNPRHVAVLMLLLLTVYTKQNLDIVPEKIIALNRLREKTLTYFGISSDIPNLSVRIQWNAPVLKSGLRILDLPGLGANAGTKKLKNGKVQKSHDDITKEAIAMTDTMVVVQNPEMLASVVKTVEQMVSNLKIKEAVVENCIVPVLNKLDTCGEGEKESALIDFKTMLQNVGVTKDIQDIFPLSAIYGEYAYEECPDKSRTLYCSPKIDKLFAKGADQKRIERKLEDLSDELADEYEGSGVEALREFFRTAFIERGKIEKSFSTITEIKNLGDDIQSSIVAQKKIYEGFVGANEKLAENAIPQLKAIANNPINQAITSLSTGNISANISLMTSLTRRVVKEYEEAFKNAAEEYYNRNMNIINSMETKFWGIGNFAIVDSSKPNNYRAYQQFLNESQCITVDMKDVNISYAEMITLIKKDIDQIFNNALIQLHSFANTYQPSLQFTIARYKNNASENVIQLFEDIIPVISEFVENQIDITETGINQANKKIEQAQIDMSNLIIDKNDKFISTVSSYTIGHTEIGTTFWGDHEQLRIDGDNGAKRALQNAKEIIGNNAEMKTTIQTVCSEQIINPMQEWYTSATSSVTDAFIEIQRKIITLLDGIAEKLKDSTGANGAFIGKLDADMEQVTVIFDSLRQSLRETVAEVLPVARSKKIISTKYARDMMAWINGGDPVGK